MGMYASETVVPIERSKAEIERTLTRYGAQEFVSGWDHARAVVMFRMEDRRIRFFLPMPNRENYLRGPGGKQKRTEQQVEAAIAQAQRQRWRALALAIKAKLEAVASGITSFESEFLAHVVMPNAQNFGEWARPQIAESYAAKKMPPMLGAGS